jgi:hypothetical protein
MNEKIGKKNNQAYHKEYGKYIDWNRINPRNSRVRIIKPAIKELDNSSNKEI